MVDVENIPERESYEHRCYTRARFFLQDSAIEDALELLLVEKDMTPDEIQAAAYLMSGMANGDFDMD